MLYIWLRGLDYLPSMMLAFPCHILRADGKDCFLASVNAVTRAAIPSIFAPLLPAYVPFAPGLTGQKLPLSSVFTSTFSAFIRKTPFGAMVMDFSFRRRSNSLHPGLTE